MKKKNQPETLRRVDAEHLREFQHEAEMDRLFYIEFEKNITAIEHHEVYMGKCLDFMSALGVPICNIRTLSGEMMSVADMYQHMTKYFEQREDYESAAKLQACEEMPESMPVVQFAKTLPLLKQYFIDSTMMMSYEESIVRVQQKMIDTTEFFGIENPHDYVKVMERVIEYHRGKLDNDKMMVLEAIKEESVQSFEMQKKEFEEGKVKTYRFYSPPKE